MPLFQYIPSFPPLWREPLCPPQGREGRTASGSLAPHVEAEPGVLATRARMTGGWMGRGLEVVTVRVFTDPSS